VGCAIKAEKELQEVNFLHKRTSWSIQSLTQNSAQILTPFCRVRHLLIVYSIVKVAIQKSPSAPSAIAEIFIVQTVKSHKTKIEKNEPETNIKKH
jgi:hypothetical protein